MSIPVSIILFLTPLLAGLLSRKMGAVIGTRFPLIFAGSFLFSITIIHILPEVFSLAGSPMQIGLYILGGFFFQQMLEYFTSGVEHGHSHSEDFVTTGSQIGLCVALMTHSILEGALLTHDSPFHEKHESYSLLIGILLHKIPAAFALMATLGMGRGMRASTLLILILFCAASPIGLLMSDWLLNISGEGLIVLFAFVSGSFLHISTTIFVESSPDHHFGWKKFLISLLGAAVAIATEMVV